MFRKPNYALPTKSFRHTIPQRLNILSVPKKQYIIAEKMPAQTEFGVRINAISGELPKTSVDKMALPYPRLLFLLWKEQKGVFGKKRLRKILKTVEKSNETRYARLAHNARVDLKKLDKKNTRPAWTDRDWSKHMEYISKISLPKPPIPEPQVVKKTIPLSQILPRLIELAEPSERYRTMSKDLWYKEPGKVSKSALTYQITPRVLELSKGKEFVPYE